MKIRNFQKHLREEGVDVALIMNTSLKDNNLFYFTGLDIEYGILIVPKSKKAIFYAPKMEYERAKRFSQVRNVKILESKREFDRLLARYFEGKNTGINADFVTLNLLRRLKKSMKPKKFTDISRLLVKTRARKNPDEIRIMQNCVDISKKVLDATLRNFRKFKTEEDAKSFMESEMRRYNCIPSFKIIFASGRNASMPHAEPDSRINEGFCIIDFGVEYKGYKSDITRTVYVGNPSDSEVRMYYELLGIQEEAIKSLKPGVDYMKVQESVVKVLGERFIHGLGHGLGIDIHEALEYERKKLILKEGNILTVEPGVYEQEKYGIRIEDDILITKRGAKVLSKDISKELIMIKF